LTCVTPSVVCLRKPDSICAFSFPNGYSHVFFLLGNRNASTPKITAI
jgi:hypothetical protein